jgi:hypothetical protein
MEKLVRIALAAFFLLGIASAQSLPSIDVFGGYSYLNLQLPQSVDTNSQRLNLNGGEGSVAVTFFITLVSRQTSAGTSLAIAPAQA